MTPPKNIKFSQFKGKIITEGNKNWWNNIDPRGHGIRVQMFPGQMSLYREVFCSRKAWETTLAIWAKSDEQRPRCCQHQVTGDGGWVHPCKKGKFPGCSCVFGFFGGFLHVFFDVF